MQTVCAQPQSKIHYERTNIKSLLELCEDLCAMHKCIYCSVATLPPFPSRPFCASSHNTNIYAIYFQRMHCVRSTDKANETFVATHKIPDSSNRDWEMIYWIGFAPPADITLVIIIAIMTIINYACDWVMHYCHAICFDLSLLQIPIEKIHRRQLYDLQQTQVASHDGISWWMNKPNRLCVKLSHHQLGDLHME